MMNEEILPSNFSHFKDILLERRHGSDLQWISREITFINAYKSDRRAPSPKDLIKRVLSNEGLLETIKNVSSKELIPGKELKAQVKDILKEIGYLYQLPIVRWLGLALVKIIKKVLTGLYVNEYKLMEIKSNMGSNPVLFVPTHRSYADFILMAFVCFSYDIQIPCVAAGMDFYSMMLMGRLLRDSKAFFMRRTFSDNKLYRLVFEYYLHELVALGESPIEFFIEGTRSRSSKSLMPKFGFLTMVLETFYSGNVPDITIIPVTISYERVLEEELFVYEHLGVPKPKESTAGLLKALNTLNQNYGNVFIDFSEPISVREFFKDKVDFVSRSKSKENYQIVELAHTIISRHQQKQVLGCIHLLSLVLTNHIESNYQQQLTLEHVCCDISWISSVLMKLGASVCIHGTIESAVKFVIKEHNNIVMLSETGIINIIQVQSNNKRQDTYLYDETMNKAVPVLLLQLYVNPCLYFLVKLSIVTALLKFTQPLEQLTYDKLLEKYKKVCHIFSHEFVLYGEWMSEDFQQSLKQLESLDLIQFDGDYIVLRKDLKLSNFLYNILSPFLVGYFIVCSVISEDKGNQVEEKHILRQSQILAEKLLLNGVIKHYYTLSLNMFHCALSSLITLQCLSKVGMNGEFNVDKSSVNAILELLGSLLPHPELQNSEDHRKIFIEMNYGEKAKL